MKKLKLILIILFLSVTALLIINSKQSNLDTNKAANQADSYSAFDMFSKYNLY
ncbi:MAG: hypothetical protein NTZ59_03275 [Bacteroidetes bacterium]|jgi:thioredoxin-related protein|nr:hypothetical protein [Bacteroidota bacterium]